MFIKHTGENLISHLKDHGIVPLFVPVPRTDKLQPLDISVNKEYKASLKAQFHDWYAN